jgi:hypothetical protein
MTTLHRKSLCPGCDKAHELVDDIHASGTQQKVTHGEIIQTMPMVLESALSYLLADFDYDAKIESNTAIGVRLIAIAAERSQILLNAVETPSKSSRAQTRRR